MDFGFSFLSHQSIKHIKSIKIYSSMRVQTEEWQRFIPGVRMYKGKKTYFYNGEKLFDTVNNEYLTYDREEQHSWEVIIILPGVEVITYLNFCACAQVEVIIMSDTVRSIERERLLLIAKVSFMSNSQEISNTSENMHLNSANL